MFVNRFARDPSGAAAVEFALVLPIMLLLYYGMTEATQALLANRRVSYVTTAVGDLTTQTTQLKKAQIDDIFNISTAVLKPFPTDTLSIRVTSIETNAKGVPTQKWSRSRGSVGALDLSDVDKTPNIAIIRAETAYTYNSPLKQIMPKALTFRHKMDLRPRGGEAVTLLD